MSPKWMFWPKPAEPITGDPVEFYPSVRTDWVNTVGPSHVGDDYVVIGFTDGASSQGLRVTLARRVGMSFSVFNTLSFTDRCNDVSSARIAPDKAIVVGRDYGNNQNLTARLVTRDGDSISSGTPASASSGICYQTHSCSAGDGKVLCAYRNHSLNQIQAVCMEYSGGVISYGTPVNIAGGGASETRPTIAWVSENRAMVAYRAAGTLQGEVRCVDISGTTLSTPEPATVFTVGNCVFPYICGVGEDRAVIVWRDDSNNFFGTVAGVKAVAGVPTIASTDVFQNDSTHPLALVHAGPDIVVGHVVNAWLNYSTLFSFTADSGGSVVHQQIREPSPTTTLIGMFNCGVGGVIGSAMVTGAGGLGSLWANRIIL